EPPRHLLRGEVVRVDAMDDLVPSELRERPVDRRDRGFGGIAPAPGVAMEGVADLGARPAVWLPWPHLPHPATAVLLEHREHRETLHGPCPRHLQETPPGATRRLVPADVAAGGLVRQQLGVAREILDPRHAQDQAFGFQNGTRIGHLEPPARPRPAGRAATVGQNALMPVSSRPTTSWWTVSVPS